MKILNILTILIFTFSLKIWAQYPFEKFQALKYNEFNTWTTTTDLNNSFPLNREITINKFDKKIEILKIKQEFKFTTIDSTEYSEITIQKNDRKISAFNIDTRSISEPLSVLVSDINGDGLNDLKIIYPNYGCGNYNYYCTVIFLFQNSDNNFNEIVFTDIFEEFENRPERDFNSDGNFEIITQTFQKFGKHNYWLFNIYNYVDGKLTNVNNIENYPIMIPLDSNQISKKISRKKMKEFEIKSPIK